VLKAEHGLAVDWIECFEASQAGVGKPVYSGMGKTDAVLRTLLDDKFGDIVAGKAFVRMLCSAENEGGDVVAMPPVVCYL
jgi:hypothetical protein